MFFVILGCVAVVRKSLPLALAFSGLLGLSVILVLVRFMADLNGIHRFQTDTQFGNDGLIITGT